MSGTSLSLAIAHLTLPIGLPTILGGSWAYWHWYYGKNFGDYYHRRSHYANNINLKLFYKLMINCHRKTIGLISFSLIL
ncbi:MAG: hypothetical protein QGI86_24360, partial [Candidatus Poribacteria bacterium]|nr:hypothetical protein [Candidatus Poribacteria bacterium]